MAKQRRLTFFTCLTGAVVVLLTGWEFLAHSSLRVGFLFGRPTDIGAELVSLIRSGGIVNHFLVTGVEALSGTFLGMLVGCSVGISLWLSRGVASAVRPVVFVLGNLPVFAFAPVMIVWFGTGLMMKIALAALSTAFVSFSLAYRGAQAVGGESLELLTAMGASKRAVFRKVIVPASLDSVFSAARLNVGFGLLGAFIGEFISSDRGLGHLILRASGLYNTSRVFAVAIGILLLALLFDRLASFVERRRTRLMQLLSVPKILR